MTFLGSACPGRRIILGSLLFVLVLLPVASLFAQQQSLQSFTRDEVIFVLADDRRHVFEVELAETWPQKIMCQNRDIFSWSWRGLLIMRYTQSWVLISMAPA